MRALSLFLCAALLLCVSRVAAQHVATITPCDRDTTPTLGVGSVTMSNASATVDEPIFLTFHGLLDVALTAGSYSWLLQRADGSMDLLDQDFGSLADMVTAGLPADKGDVAITISYTIADTIVLLPSDQSVLLRFEASDQAQNLLFCEIVHLPLNVAPPAPPSKPHDNKVLGYCCALISVLFFGTNFLPVKAFDTGDGVFFQWLLCLGIWLCGLIVQLIRNSAFEPLAMVGGMLWCLGNTMTVPIINLIGLGVGMCLWGTATLIMGWASGRFGMFGIHKQRVESEAMNIVGLILCVLSMGIMFQVKSVKEEQAARNSALDHQLLLDDSHSITSERSIPLHKRPFDDDGSPAALEAGAVAVEPKWTDKLSVTTRRLLGVAMSLAAGCCYGLNFTPPQYLMDSGKGKSSHGIDYVFSHFCGILLTSTAYLIAYCVYRRNQPWVSPSIVLPGMASGIGWAIAQIAWFVANDQIHFVGTFPLVSCGPGIVATLCAIGLYKEIQGRKNYMFLGATAAVTIAGVVLIALSLPAGS